MEVICPCPYCKKWMEVETLSAKCAECGRPLFEFITDDLNENKSLSQCPACGCTHMYRQKDFNRAIGVAILVVGIAFAYFTYGISLLVVTLLDWLLFRRVKEVGCCYDCGAQYRKTDLVKTLEPFNLVLHDHYKNRKKS